MTVDTLGMIRRGWQDGVATVAPQVPGLADLLEKRLGEAVRLGTLDEASLLTIVEAATQLAADSGAVDVAPALSKRLRRHVYEYLLSLDALSDDEKAAPAVPKPSARADSSVLIGVDEVAALGRARVAEAQAPAPAAPPPEAEAPPAEEPEPEAAPTPVSAAPQATTPAEELAAETPPTEPVSLDVSESPGMTELPPPADLAAPEPVWSPAPETFVPAPVPRFSFHIGDPEDLLTSTPEPTQQDTAGLDGGLPELFAPVDLEPPTTAGAAPHRASFADPSTWPKPVTPTLRGGRGSSPTRTAVSPEAAPSSLVPHVRPVVTGEPIFEDLAWPQVTTVDSEPAELVVPEPSVPAEPAPSPARAAPEIPPAIRPAPLSNEELLGPPSRPLTANRSAEAWTAPRPTREVPPTWSPRQPEPVEPHAPPQVDAESNWPMVTDQVSERDLVQLRANVEDRLRRKRCDEAAAVLQQAAQELGGQAVAELALDAGDRCRTLGKRNAALNCYLAASRADPVYEAPLARLADICIDDQDIDLAVSYLERIARLTRLRGDQRGALRIYRKIATIAPYRDDVLEMLMRAQTSGRIDG